MKKQRGFVHILVSIFVVLGIGVLGYLAWQKGLIKNKSEKPAPQPSGKIDTSKKTYNSNFNFSFQYPSSLQISSVGSGPGAEVYEHISFVRDNEKSNVLTITVYDKKGLSEKNWVNKYKGVYLPDNASFETPYVQGNLNLTPCEYPNGTPDNRISKGFIFSNNKYVFHLDLNKDNSEIRDAINLILSTFKFISSSDTLNKINFKVNLPDNWKSETKIIERSETLILTRNESDTDLPQKDMFPTRIYIGSCAVYSSGCSIGANGNGFRSEFDATLLGKTAKAETATRYTDSSKKSFAETQFQLFVYDKFTYPSITGAYYAEKEKSEILQIISTFEFLD